MQAAWAGSTAAASRARHAWSSPDPRIGEHVMVHVGFAISRVDAEEAARTYDYLAETDQLEEIGVPKPPPEKVP